MPQSVSPASVSVLLTFSFWDCVFSYLFVQSIYMVSNKYCLLWFLCWGVLYCIHHDARSALVKFSLLLLFWSVHFLHQCLRGWQSSNFSPWESFRLVPFLVLQFLCAHFFYIVNCRASEMKMSSLGNSRSIQHLNDSVKLRHARPCAWGRGGGNKIALGFWVSGHYSVISNSHSGRKWCDMHRVSSPVYFLTPRNVIRCMHRLEQSGSPLLVPLFNWF